MSDFWIGVVTTLLVEGVIVVIGVVAVVIHRSDFDAPRVDEEGFPLD